MTSSRLLIFAAWAGVIGIIALSVVPGRDRPHTAFTGHEEHFAAYALTGIAFAIGLRRAAARGYAVAGLALLSITLEVAQHFTPGRHPAISDAAFSSLGGAAGIAIGAAMVRFFRREQRV